MEKSTPFRIEYRREQPPNFLSPCNFNTSDQDKPHDSLNSNLGSNKRKALSGGRLRFWSEEDEIRILEALLEFVQEHGATNVSDDAFYNRMKVLLRKGFEKTQLRDKIRKLKAKYNKNVMGGCGVEGVTVSHHTQVAFDLSDKMWGHGELAMNSDGSVVKVVVGKKDNVEEEDDDDDDDEENASGSKEDNVSLELNNEKNEMEEVEEIEIPVEEESSIKRSKEKQDEDMEDAPTEDDVSSEKKDIPTEEDVSSDKKHVPTEEDVSSDKKETPTEEDVSSDKKETPTEEERIDKPIEVGVHLPSTSCCHLDRKDTRKRKKRKRNIKGGEMENDCKEKKQVPLSISYPFLHELFDQFEEKHGLKGIARIASQNIAHETAMAFERKLRGIFDNRLKLEMKRNDIIHRVFQFVKDLKAT